jgi:phosphonate transport system substrate-binding protein
LALLLAPALVMFRFRNAGIHEVAACRYPLVTSLRTVGETHMKRRHLLVTGAGACAGAWAGSPAAAAGLAPGSSGSSTLRFGTTPVFLDDQVGFLARWGAYLSAAVGTPVQFVQRRSYRDIMGLLRSQEIEAAWICGFPWVVNKRELRGLSIPLYEGAPLYRSYLIVPASDTRTTRHGDLAGKVFAFSDPDSNSGYLVPRTTMLKAGIDPDRHFSRTFFTWGHKNVVRAVADGLADGGSVDGYVWETLGHFEPALVAKTRVAWRSSLYGFPPLAVRGSLDKDVEARLRRALFAMTESNDGRDLLAELNLTGFGPFRDEVFDGIAELVKLIGAKAA